MKILEDALSSQRSHEVELMQGTNRTMLIVAGTFACFGFLALLLLGYFQWRTVSRLAEISAVLPQQGRSLPMPRARAVLSAGEASVTALSDGDDDTGLLATVKRLEQRIHELENHASPRTENGTHENGEASEAQAPSVETEASPHEPDRITTLLGKGQSLLNVEKPEEALICFDEALALDPKNPEALVKKGATLERLRKLNEAIQCYDRAIQADSSMTIAYLYKGGLCNRMERFNEALECYEQALRTQEKRAA